MLQSSAVAKGNPKQASTPAGDVDGWYETDLPATVLGALVEAGVYENPFFGRNLESIPGQGPKAVNFSNHSMPEESPFKKAWWYRKVFTVPTRAQERLHLRFDGINYRANIWLNGEKVADDTEVMGAYRDFELDITSHANRDGENVLLVEVFPPRKGDIAITWVDWHPSPPDKNVGLWRDVWLLSSGPVKMRSPQVVTKREDDERVRLLVGCDITNATDMERRAHIAAEVDGATLTADIELAPRETRYFEGTICLENPKLWWPRFMGEQALYEAKISVRSNGTVSDAASFCFGIREVTSELTEDGHTLFRVNGEPILVRGAGWATDLFLRRDEARDLAQLEYVKAMNLNVIRFEGMLERASFLEWCDREGILVVSGWSCCDAWEKWDDWSDEHVEVARESLRSQIKRSRRHPCLISWWYGSDFAPPEHVEKCYLDVLKEERWPNAQQSSAANKPTAITGPSGMKMEGPYDYVPPSYWLEDTERGGAFGFATEVCPGPAVPPIESLKKMMPEADLWPISDMWNYHSGGQEFHNIDLFKDALFNRYGECDSAETFARFSQLMTYEAERAMFEAYARNKFKSTGVIQWMLNNSWPSLIWHLYDYYLRPGGGFFGTKKACEPLHVMFATDDRSVVVTNDFPHGFDDLKVSVDVLSLKSSYLISKRESVSVKGASRAKVLELPYLDGVSPIYFIDLRLEDADNNLLSHNFYWIPAVQDVLDHEKGFWIHTPIKSFANLQGLREQQDARVEVEAFMAVDGDATDVEVTLRNSPHRVAFFTELRLADARGNDILPVDWTDNYVSLLPGRAQTVRARVGGAFKAGELKLHVSGINVPDQVFTLGRPAVTTEHSARP